MTIAAGHKLGIFSRFGGFVNSSLVPPPILIAWSPRSSSHDVDLLTLRNVRRRYAGHMHLAADTRLGRYEIRSKLGEGGIGEVYFAQDTQLRRPVALKFDLSRDGQQLALSRGTQTSDVILIRDFK